MYSLMNTLSFILWNPDPIIGHFGFITFRWYATCWIVGLLLGTLLMHRLYRQQGIPDEKFDPLFLHIFFGVLIGARLGHCIFYDPGYFLSSWDHFIEMLIPFHHMPDGSWKLTGFEGLASHGGVAGMLVAIAMYCRSMKVSAWVVLDNMGICSGITATFIRLGNLMNSEIIGKATDVPWAFIFERVDQQPRHPGQLYEAIAYLCFFLIILFIYKKKGPKSVGTGFYFGLCLTLIFTFRFLVEYAKEIQVDFEATLPMDMGQILSLPLIAVGVACLVGGKWMEKLGARSRK